MPTKTYANLPEEKREKILTVAAQEFADRSYRLASLSKIVRELEIAKGSLYQYFEGKRGLYRFVIEWAMEKKIAYVASLTPPCGSLFDRLRWLARVGSGFEEREPLAARLLECAAKEDDSSELLPAADRGAVDFFSPLLEEAKFQLREDLGFDIAVFALSTLFSHFGRFLEGRRPEEREQLFDNLLNLLAHGMER